MLLKNAIKTSESEEIKKFLFSRLSTGVEETMLFTSFFRCNHAGISLNGEEAIESTFNPYRFLKNAHGEFN